MEFTQNDIERELSDTIPQGKRREIAQIARLGESIVYGYLNPDDERKSPAYLLLSMQSAMDEIDPAMGDAHWNKLADLRSASRPATIGRQPRDVDDVLRELELEKESSDVLIARLKHLPIASQLTEISELRAKLAEYEQTIVQQRRAEAIERINQLKDYVQRKTDRLPDRRDLPGRSNIYDDSPVADGREII